MKLLKTIILLPLGIILLPIGIILWCIEYLLVEVKVKKILKGEDLDEFGACHLHWKTKKEVYKKYYGIDWKSPAELNPHTRYD